MPLFRTLACLGVLTIAAPDIAVAQDLPPAVQARQAQFTILAYNLGVLGAMAKGEAEYDADAAGAAASNIVTITELNQSLNWHEGTDNAQIEGTRALPAIWENLDDVVSKWKALGTAAQPMVAAAAEGPEAIGPALGQLGDACKDCHDDYRQPQ